MRKKRKPKLLTLGTSTDQKKKQTEEGRKRENETASNGREIEKQFDREA